MTKYNDDAIISPEKIEQMARDYALAKNNNKLIRQAVELHKLKSEFSSKNLCYTYIKEANNCIDTLIKLNPKNTKLEQCNENIKKIDFLYGTYFTSTALQATTLELEMDNDLKIVSLMLSLINELIPLSSDPTIQDIVRTALNTIELAVL